MNYVASNYLSLNYQKSTSSGSIDLEIRKLESLWQRLNSLYIYLNYKLLIITINFIDI